MKTTLVQYEHYLKTAQRCEQARKMPNAPRLSLPCAWGCPCVQCSIKPSTNVSWLICYVPPNQAMCQSFPLPTDMPHRSEIASHFGGLSCHPLRKGNIKPIVLFELVIWLKVGFARWEERGAGCNGEERIRSGASPCGFEIERRMI